MSDPIIVSVRSQSSPAGGPVVPYHFTGQLNGARELLVLVHGFNDSYDYGLKVYKAFLEKLNNQFSTGTSQVVEFLWPGDEPNKLLSTVAYPLQIAKARQSAVELDKFLWAFPGSGQTTIHFVGHSLGCRIIMEILTRWANAGPPPNMNLRTVVLMAGAVVVKHVDIGGRFRPGATLCNNNPVLYSKGDHVNQWAFPAGETAGGEGFFPTAVGRTGGPPNTWHTPQPMATPDGNPYGHSNYWFGTESAASVAFALGGAPPRATPLNAITSNPAPEASDLPDREIPPGFLIARPAFA